MAAADPFRIVEARFLAAAAPGSSLPAPTTVEVAFAGRSNVGKSSLINTLVDRRGLVRTSSTPGSTRQINLFEAKAKDGALFHLVDLPGYGFTRRSKAETKSWAALIEGYLSRRVTLAALVLLCDLRRGFEEDDLLLAGWVAEAAPGVQRREVTVIPVATKADKVPRSGRKVALAAITASLAKQGLEARAIGFSSETGEGKAELWAAIRRAALPAPGPEPPADAPPGP